MKVKVSFFAFYRDLVNLSSTELVLEEGTTAGEVKRILEDRFPSLRGHFEGMVAINSNYVEPGFILREGDEVCYLPPFSGGMNG